jgi:hypothetical protein
MTYKTKSKLKGNYRLEWTKLYRNKSKKALDCKEKQSKLDKDLCFSI